MQTEREWLSSLQLLSAEEQTTDASGGLLTS